MEFGVKKQQPKESDDCQIEIKQTKQGKKIKISGKCSREQLRALNNVREDSTINE